MGIAKIAKEILSYGSKFSREQTENALQKMAFNESRTKMLQNPDFRKIIAHPELEKGYIFGSTASEKPNPTDVDFLGITTAMHPSTPRAVAEARFSSMDEILDKYQNMREISKEGTIDAHLIERPLGGSTEDWQDKEGFITYLMKEARKRYGNDYTMKGVLGASGVALPSIGSFQPETSNK